jgi:hypothetical protein
MARTSMLRLLLFALVLAASSAGAQQVILQPTGQDNVDTVRFNKEGCTQPLSLTWTSTLLTAPCSALRFWSTQAECGDAPAAGDVQYQDVPIATVFSVKTGSFTIQLNQLPAFANGDGGLVCGSEAVEKTQKVCGVYGSLATTAVCTPQHVQFLNVIYDTKPPPAPVINSISEQDSALQVNFSVTDTALVRFETRAAGEADFSRLAKTVEGTATSFRISDLKNGTTYEVRALAEDSAGNLSDPSEAFPATPRHTLGFWDNYRRAGGSEQGCSGVAGLPLVLAGGLWLLRRKRNG